MHEHGGASGEARAELAAGASVPRQHGACCGNCRNGQGDGGKRTVSPPHVGPVGSTNTGRRRPHRNAREHLDHQEAETLGTTAAEAGG